MIEIQIRETDEFIKLGQALKKAGLVESGVCLLYTSDAADEL